MMGGAIWVESEQGNGSKFHFTTDLKVHQCPMAAAQPGTERLRNLPVLIVDDNATNRSVLRRIVSNWQMRGEEAESGEMALEMMRKASDEMRPFALVLLDVNMPGMDGFDVARAIRNDALLCQTKMMMISSATRPGDAQMRQALDIAGHMSKPVRKPSLLKMILSAIGGEESGRSASSSCSAKSTVTRKARILLAEDNLVNQRLAVRMLEKQGHSVELAVNGAEAVQAWQQGDFDLILMDMQMPEMDGLEAVAEIRRLETFLPGKPAIPVIALTAHAMKGDRERCLAAGMQDYVSKPIKTAALYGAIAKAMEETALPSAGPGV
jgi:CheY-like chemotaxis protein